MRLWVHTRSRSPSWLRRRLSPPTRTPSPVESKKSTPSRSTTIRCLPSLTSSMRRSRKQGAVDLARRGRSVAVSTGTASGKSLCYQLPIAEAALGDPPGTALLVFPTKALAQDQLRALGALDVPGLVAVTYDGDTPPNERTWA